MPVAPLPGNRTNFVVQAIVPIRAENQIVAIAHPCPHPDPANPIILAGADQAVAYIDKTAGVDCAITPGCGTRIDHRTIVPEGRLTT